MADMESLAQSEFRMDGIPGLLVWRNAPESWAYQGKALTIKAAARTDMFHDPQKEYSVVNSPSALFAPAPTFMLSSKVKVDFRSDYDAGVLLLFAGKERWAKLCFELSPEKTPTLVSVVNNGLSDDVNHREVGKNEVYLRICSLSSGVFAFHYSIDGRFWGLLRYFHMESREAVRVGFSSQSPTGNSCVSVFSEISYSTAKLENIRNGE
jgi:uncharacterized protein